eukprot:UN18998
MMVIYRVLYKQYINNWMCVTYIIPFIAFLTYVSVVIGYDPVNAMFLYRQYCYVFFPTLWTSPFQALIAFDEVKRFIDDYKKGGSISFRFGSH